MLGEPQNNSNVISLHDHRCWAWDSESLEILIEELVTVNSATENSFLELGSKIKLFHGSAQEISKIAGEVLQLLNGDDGENTLQHLQLLVERCSLWLDATAEKSIDISALLKSVTRQIAELSDPVHGLRKVIKTLHSLRVSTRIEAAKGYASGAGVLAGSLDELGSLVHEKTTDISDRIDTLLLLINKSLEMEETAQCGAIKVASQEVNRARDLLSAFMANCIETGQWTGRLKERSNDVTQNFGEMISALQFQDITRQRLEHVQDVLTGLGQHFDKFSQRSDFNNDEEATRLFGRICRLQYDQICLASKDFLTAERHLSENLQGMVGSVVSMAKDTRELSRATVVGCDSRFVAVLDVLKSITDYLDETHHVHKNAWKHLSAVCDGIQEVNSLVDEVELIGEEMQLLAMNAAISAAHARQRGAGLDIIAQNIHIVAGEATGYAVMMASECAKITGHAERLQDVGRENQSSTGDIGALLADAQKSTTTIEANNSKLVDFAAEVERSAERLSDDVNATVRCLDIRREFEEKLSPALERLNRLSSSSGDDEADLDDSSLDALFNDLERCYTMDSERLVHMQFIEKDGPLQSAVSQETDEWSANRDHDLGDNVDLF